MFKKIKDALFSPPTEEQQIQEERNKIAKQLGGPFNAGNNGNKWYGFTWKEVHADYFGYFHWQGQYFHWREEKYNNEAASLVLMGHAFSCFFKGMKKATTEYPTPEETAFMEASKPLWEQVTPTFGHMTEQQAIELFFGYCLGPATPLRHQENYNMSCPFEQTYLFHTNRARCTSMEEARRLDEAYYVVFRATMAKINETDFLRYIDHPYTPILAGSLDAAIPLPGVEEDLSLPDKATTHAKIELVILNDLLAEENGLLRDYLEMTGTRLGDYEVSTAAYAVKDSKLYCQFVEKIISNTRSVDWVLTYLPRMLKDIKEKLKETHVDPRWQEYVRKQSFEKVADIYHGWSDGQEATYQDWLQERRDEAERVFAQFAHATGVKRAAPVEAAIEAVEVVEPVTVKTQRKEIMEAPAPSSAMARPFVKKAREKLPPVAASGEMTVEHAREVFDYAKDEIPKLKELRQRYQLFVKRNLDEVIQEEIDEAFAVLLKIAV
jgi:hypothetical protein